MLKKYNYLNLLTIIPFGLGLYVALNDGIIYGFEKGVFDLLRHLAPAADIPFVVLTELGSAVGAISMAVLILIGSIFAKHFWDFGLPVALISAVSRGINMLAKTILDRPRPEFRVVEASNTSFPSGHAQNNMTLYIAILIAALLIVKAPKIRLAITITCIVLPFIIGITRLYFGVHYLSDVVAGWAIGFFVTYNLSFVYFKLLNKFVSKEDKNAQERS